MDNGSSDNTEESTPSEYTDEPISVGIFNCPRNVLRRYIVFPMNSGLVCPHRNIVGSSFYWQPQKFEVLKLLECNLFGKLPSSLGNLSYLTHLDLDGNDFTGELPDSMGNLNQLTKLILASSKLSGNFPHVLLNLSDLTTTNLHFNQLEGTLPANMSSLSKLEYFNIGSNSFSGFVSSSLFMIPSLIHLSLERNGFNGPLEIGNISSPSELQTLSLGGNNLKGPIPRFISKLAGLSCLDLSFWNTISGMVDFRIFLHLKSLTFPDLSHLNTRSMVDMSLLSHLMSLSLVHLSASDNQFSGEIPKIICELDSLDESVSVGLVSLDVSHNQLSGELPKSLINFTYLQFLNVEDNMFNDTFPFWLRVLPGLQFLVLF
ncbi:BnaC01g23080D [Brassica napus]|uniref:BnaC01g23080D protein n=1 Tax=Brassica napus TaxID=3708 RepID=A0A078FV39_BRANA|nr:BnaC01g23080D [Brassica napus]